MCLFEVVCIGVESTVYILFSFRSSAPVPPGALTLTGTRLYCAPEVISGEPPNEANDASRAELSVPTSE